MFKIILVYIQGMFIFVYREKQAVYNRIVYIRNIPVAYFVAYFFTHQQLGVQVMEVKGSFNNLYSSLDHSDFMQFWVTSK